MLSSSPSKRGGGLESRQGLKGEAEKNLTCLDSATDRDSFHIGVRKILLIV